MRLSRTREDAEWPAVGDAVCVSAIGVRRWVGSKVIVMRTGWRASAEPGHMLEMFPHRRLHERGFALLNVGPLGEGEVEVALLQMDEKELDFPFPAVEIVERKTCLTPAVIG